MEEAVGRDGSTSVDGRRAVAGVIVFPALREIVSAATGLGTSWATGVGDPGTPLHARPAHVSSVADLDLATISITSFNEFGEAGITGAFARLAGPEGASEVPHLFAKLCFSCRVHRCLRGL